ncbi:hypothetical protein VV01_19360 [Luteipulveratus halotolerans]|uniref:YCII-related domain-containing protein n=2 Tax=Luteipulveratus halotolerans TaxID=1631356 RepID=A0A0L6CPN5_9MICO|nr:hypothetical protein VV01_19360 [Luteipulveratus halotolerans]
MFGTVGWGSLSETERGSYYAQHRAFADAVDQRPGCRLVGGNALTGGADATMVRFAGAHQAVTQGPYAGATDQLGGYYEVEAPATGDVLELVRHLPSSYTIEIRPVLDSA